MSSIAGGAAGPSVHVGYLEERLPVGLNALLALLVSSIWFAVSAALLAPITPGSLVVAALVAVDLVAVLVTAWWGGIVYAVPLGVASTVAIDWHLIPPTHASAVPTSSNAVAIAAYLLTGVLLGCLAFLIRRRAARAEQGRRLLAEEQAAIRRVATLVARGVDPDEVFAGVTTELGALLTLDTAALLRIDPDDRLTVVGWTGPSTKPSLLGSRIVIPASGTADDVLGLRSEIHSSVAVAGRPWGLVVAGSTTNAAVPDEAQVRIAEFTELIGLAIANSQARIELKASRTRIVTAADAARKRLERDLHDGVQQRLVAFALQARLIEANAQDPSVRAALDTLGTQLGEVVDELRELSHGLHPAIIASGGLKPALATLGRRAPIPVELSYRGDADLPESVMVGCYYLVAEALTNTAKHAAARHATIGVEVQEESLTVTVSDDGSGGADLDGGTGLIGLQDRVEALGGSFHVSSPVGAGTVLTARLPLVPPPVAGL
ncbi:MAG TPA: histidine kinase [Microlunatus sp.]|nr:histidine kinase [Microlunatus sp.]